MVKRNAQSDLNHDNWDHDDEKEEAGEFKKANEDQMKGRVIKKAKRRNLNEDQKKNIFSSFGGFTSSNNVAVADAFSFLAKPKADGPESKPVQPSGFVFGAGSTETKKEEENHKEQDNKMNEKEVPEEADNCDSLEISKIPEPTPAAPVDDLFAKFMKPKAGGSWTCDVCMISNPGDRMTCIACESPRPGAAPVAASKPPEPASVTPAAPVNDLFAKFIKPKAGGSWTCDVCMISNPGDRMTCIACESPRPGAAPVAAPAEEKQPAHTFQFGSSGGFKFGSGDSSSKADTSASNNGFSFGSTNPLEATENPTGGFKFGSSAQSSKEPNPSGGFAFGETKESIESNSGFKFGSTTAESNEEPKQSAGFSFGVQGAETVEEEKKTSGFSFGVSSDISKSSLASVSTPVSKGFQFSEKMGLKVAMSASDTPKTKSNKGEYLSSLKSLNTQVTSWIKSHVDQNPLIDLTPVFKDYEKHISDMRNKCSIKAPVMDSAEKAGMKEATKALTFGVSANPSPSLFTSSSIGNSQSIFGSAPKTGFSFGFGNSQTNKETSKEDVREEEEKEEESSSPEKPTEPVVEEDALYTRKCKLFYKKADSYEERGLGNIHLKMTEDKKLQMIVRAATSLGNILLNVLVTPETPVERLGKNNVMIVTIPNPPIEKKESDQKPVTFLIRVKTAEDADELKDKIVSLGK